MENALIIFPNSKAEASLYKQLAKSLKNRVEEKKDKGSNTKKIAKEKFLTDLKESIREMKLHEEGKLHLKTAEELLDEL